MNVLVLVLIVNVDSADFLLISRELALVQDLEEKEWSFYNPVFCCYARLSYHLLAIAAARHHLSHLNVPHSTTVHLPKCATIHSIIIQLIKLHSTLRLLHRKLNFNNKRQQQDGVGSAAALYAFPLL